MQNTILNEILIHIMYNNRNYVFIFITLVNIMYIKIMMCVRMMKKGFIARARFVLSSQRARHAHQLYL